MHPGKALLLLAVLLLALLASSPAEARPRGQLAVQELTDIATDMAHTLDEVIGMLGTDRVRSRRRRLVHFQVGRMHYSRHHGSGRHRRLRYRKQRASRNPNISDH